MPYGGLAEFLETLERAGELARVAAEVDPELELAAIVERVAAEQGPAILFENVRGHSAPVAANLLGSRRRIELALGVESLEEIAARVARLVRPETPGGWLETLKNIPFNTSLARLPARLVSTAACQQVLRIGRDVNLGELPIPRAWPKDVGPAITAGQVYTRSPETGTRNVCNYPLVVTGPRELAVCWHAYHGGARHYREASERGEPLPVAIALGGDPAELLMALAPLPPEIDECLFGGLLRGKAIELVRCRQIDMEAPADAELVIEGQIEPGSEAELGPVGLPTGYYRLPERTARITVTAVTQRANPILPTIVAGKPPHELGAIAAGIERIFLPLVQAAVPELVDYAQPTFAAPNSLMFVAIKKTFPGQAAKVAHALWGYEPFMLARTLVILDAPADVHNAEQVWAALAANCDPARDAIRSTGPIDGRLHASPAWLRGEKIALDATRKFAEEQPRGWPERTQTAAELAEYIGGRWAELGLSAVDSPPRKRRTARS